MRTATFIDITKLPPERRHILEDDLIYRWHTGLNLVPPKPKGKPKR